MAGLVRGKVAASHADVPAWPEVARRLDARRPRALSLAAVAVLLTAALLRWSPVVWWLAEPLRVARPPAAADGIVVLAGGSGESGVAGQGHEERLARAIALYRQGYAPKLMLCSGYIRAFREPDVMRAIALDEGVPDSAILLARLGGSTGDMIAEADAWARRLGWRRVLLVSSPYHMRRALYIWRKIDPGMEVLATPALRSDFYGYREVEGRVHHRDEATLEQMGGIVREYLAILYYAVRGRS
jgi:uncharacterized SAM-binding protein YcdF (DUF218 family)